MALALDISAGNFHKGTQLREYHGFNFTSKYHRRHLLQILYIKEKHFIAVPSTSYHNYKAFLANQCMWGRGVFVPLQQLTILSNVPCLNQFDT